MSKPFTPFLAGLALIFIYSGCARSGPEAGSSRIQSGVRDGGELELFHDDGLPEAQHSPWVDRPGSQLAVRFSPESYPVRLTKARFLVGIGGVPTTEFRVRVFGGSAETGPNERLDLLGDEVRASAAFGNKWVEADLSDKNIQITEGDFFVSMEWLTPPGDHGLRAQLIAVDYSNPDRRSWWKTDERSPWVRIEDVSDIGDRDLMIRATIAGK